ncbi:MAG: hypothetical protein AB7O62_04790 [Pirellulales bacterium]
MTDLRPHGERSSSSPVSTGGLPRRADISLSAANSAEQARPENGPARQVAHPDSQFSLSGVLLVIGLFALLLGPIVWLRVPWFAGLMGVGSLLVLAVISIFNDRQRVVKFGWLVLLAMYVSALITLYIHS